MDGSILLVDGRRFKMDFNDWLSILSIKKKKVFYQQVDTIDDQHYR
jgi:hypothetical protein